MPSVSSFKSSTPVEVKKDTVKDPILQKLMMVGNNGWPEHKNAVDKDTLSYWDVRGTIAITESIRFKG